MTVCRWASRVAGAVGAAVGAVVLITVFSTDLRKGGHDDLFPSLRRLGYIARGLRRELQNAMPPESLEGGMLLFPAVPVYEAPVPNTSVNASTHLVPQSLEGGMLLFPPVVLKEPVAQPGSDITTQAPWEDLGGGMILFPPMALGQQAVSGGDATGMVLFPPVPASGLSWNQTTSPAPTPTPTPAPTPAPAPTSEDLDGNTSTYSTSATTVTSTITSTSTTTTTSTVTTLMTSTTSSSRLAPKVRTELSSEVMAGSTSLTLNHVDGLSSGMQISIADVNSSETATIVQVIRNRRLSSDGRRLASGTITIDSPLQFDYEAGATVTGSVPQGLGSTWELMDTNNDGVVSSDEFTASSQHLPQGASFSDVDANGDSAITYGEFVSWEQSSTTTETTTTTITQVEAAAEDSDKDDNWWVPLVIIIVALIVAWICFVSITKSVLHLLEKRKRRDAQEEEKVPFKDDRSKDEEVINIGGPPSHAAHEVVPVSGDSRREDGEDKGDASGDSEIFQSAAVADEAKASEEAAAPRELPTEEAAAPPEKESEEVGPPRDKEQEVDLQARSSGEAVAPIEKTQEEDEAEKPPPELPPAPPPAPGPFMQSFDKDYYSQHGLRSVSGQALEAINQTPYQEYHRAAAEQRLQAAEQRLQAAVEADSLSELTSAIAYAKCQAVPADVVWYAEVCRRRRTVVAEIQDTVETLTGKRASAKLWRALWAKKMTVLQDLLEQARKDADSVLQELQSQQ